MVVTSAGILLHRQGAGAGTAAGAEVFIAHMGGPFWARKDDGAWSIPKGEFDPQSESAWDAARREFREELGIDPPDTEYRELGTFAYSPGKRLTVFAGDGSGFEASRFVFGTFAMEWPPRSGRIRDFPEVDRAEWMPVAQARTKLVTGQHSALDALMEE